MRDTFRLFPVGSVPQRITQQCSSQCTLQTRLMQQRSMRKCCTVLSVIAMALGLSMPAQSQDEAWKKEQLADAKLAAPAVVTDTAKIYAWNDDAEMIQIQDGDGPFVCVASGLLSTRVGKPALPFPDPACFDQNAWAFFQAFWAEPNPLQPANPYPTAPGVVWMLGGMAVSDGMVQVGTEKEAEIAVMDSGNKLVRLSPHFMIMPLPVEEGDSIMVGKYNTDHPHANWTMFAGTPLEHLMVHFTDDETARLMGTQ